MKRRQFNKLLTGAAAGLTLGGPLLSASRAMADEALKVGFVYVGPIGDHGWTYQHDQGRLAMEKHFAGKVKTTYVENVSEGADAERVIRNLAQSGHKLIFTTSFGFMNATVKVARQFPNVKFEHATGYKLARNLSTYVGKTYEGRYVAGYVASQMTKSNKIGYIASFPIPEVIRDIDAVQLALNKYNPDAELKIIWVNSWFDPGKESDAANAMIDQGVDVILQHTDSPAAMQTAERRGVYAVGQASDMSKFGPHAQLLAVVDNWGPHYIKETQKVLDGTWKSEAMVEGMAEDAIVIPGFNSAIPDKVVSEAKSLIAGIKDGSVLPFAGPIKNQAGELKVKSGEALSWNDLEKMNWYVEGINAELPQ